MATYIKYPLTLLLISYSVHARMDWDEFFDKQIQAIEKTRDQMQEIFKSMATAEPFKKDTITWDIQDTDKEVVVTIKGIKTDKLDAVLNDANSVLTVTLPSGHIKLAIDGSLISLNIKQNVVQETKKENNDKQTSTEYYRSARSFVQQSTIAGQVNLEQHTIDYVPDEGTLVIKLPKTVKSAGKPVPVNIIKKSDEKKEETKKVKKEK